MNTIEVKTLKKLSLALVREIIEKYDAYRAAPQTYKFATRFERLALVARFCRAIGFARLLEGYRDALYAFEKEKDESLRQKGGLEICAALNLFGVELSTQKSLPLVKYSRVHHTNKDKIQVFAPDFRVPFASIDANWSPRIDASERIFQQSLHGIISSELMMNSHEFITLHDNCVDENAVWLIALMGTLVENGCKEWFDEIRTVLLKIRSNNYGEVLASEFPERAFDYINANALRSSLSHVIFEDLDAGKAETVAHGQPADIEDVVKFISAINSLKEAWISASSSMNFGTILRYTKEFKKKAHKLKSENFSRLCVVLAESTELMRSRNEEIGEAEYTGFVDQLIAFFVDGAIAIQVMQEIVQAMKNNVELNGIESNVADIEVVLRSYTGRPEHRIIEFPESLLVEIREKSNKLLVKKMIDNFESIKSVLDGKFAEVAIKDEVNFEKFARSTYSMISEWIDQVYGISKFLGMIHLADSCVQLANEVKSAEMWSSEIRKDRLVHGVAEIVLHLESIDYPMPEDMELGILLKEESLEEADGELTEGGHFVERPLDLPDETTAVTVDDRGDLESPSALEHAHDDQGVVVSEVIEPAEFNGEVALPAPVASLSVTPVMDNLDATEVETEAWGATDRVDASAEPVADPTVDETPQVELQETGSETSLTAAMESSLEDASASTQSDPVNHDPVNHEVTLDSDPSNEGEAFEEESSEEMALKRGGSLEHAESTSNPPESRDEDGDEGDDDDFSIFDEVPVQRDYTAVFSNENRFDSIPADIVDGPDQTIVRVLLDEIDAVEPQVGACILSWRENLLDSAHVAACMENLKRHVHTIKGACRTVGFLRSGYVLHLIEDEMDALSDAPPVAVLDLYEEVIASAIDAVRNYRFDAVKQNSQLAESSPGHSLPHEGVDRSGTHHGTSAESESIRVSTKVIEDIGLSSGEVAILNSRTVSDLDFAWRSMDEMGRNLDRLQGLLKEVEIQAEVRIEAGKEVLNDAAGRANFDPLELDRYTRLHEITKSLGENILDILSSKSDLSAALNRIDEVERKKGYLTEEIQSETGRLMVVPFASQRARIERVVSKACRATRKLAKVTILGDMDIPSVLCEKVMPVLEHIFRNSVTHGIETPNARMEAGKKETGNVYVHIQPNGGQCLIKIRDDGAGIDPIRILDKAIEKGLATAGGKYDQDDIYNFLFMSGFSTADSITELAGRGVGLDAVKQSVTELGGTISIESVKGEYTEFSINIPIDISTATVIPVVCGDYQFMIPSSLIVKVVSTLSSKVSSYNDGDDIILEGLSCKYMQARSLIGEIAGKSRSNPRGFTNFVICSTDGTNLLALHVDHVDVYKKIVVRPVSRHISRISGIVAATVMGDGVPSLIINPIRMKPVRSSLDVSTGQQSDTKVILMADDSSTVRMVTSRFLRKQGFEVIEAVDGLEALEHIKNGARPDLFMLDIEMPRMDGFELTEAIRKNHAVMNTPIIMITSRIAQKHRDHAIKLGVNDYIGKPYEEKELLSVIKKYLYTENDYI